MPNSKRATIVWRICFAIAVWRLNASRSPDQAYRAAAAAGMSGLIVVGLALTWLLL